MAALVALFFCTNSSLHLRSNVATRNHNTDDGIDQDPVALGPGVVAASVKALDLRYALLPQLYTFMVAAHLRGTPVARPLFFNFPQDARGYNVAESEFMLGDSLLVAPVLEEV